MTHQEGRLRPVLIIDLAKRYGGAEVRVLDTAKALHGRHPYAVATLVGSPLHQRLEAAKLVSLPVPFSRGDPRLFFFIRRAIRQEGYGVLDAHNVQSQFWGHLAATLAGAITKVSTVHSAYKLEHNNSLKGRMYELVLRLNARLGVQFIAVSEMVYNYLQDIGIPPERISLIHNSIHLPKYSSPNRNHPLLKSLRWEEDVYIVIVVARLEPVKGHTFLIEALSQVVRERPQLRCLIVGEGRTRNALDTQIKSANLHNQVRLAGFRDDIPALLGASDAFCLPSLSEGLPYALLEACAHRLPLLVTKVGGMAELLTHKHTAFLVPPSDPASLAEGLCWLIDHPQEAAAMGQTAFEWLQQHFNPDEMIAKTLAVYH
jgi:glycosyltransferase involved in cell wall biosynthesis